MSYHALNNSLKQGIIRTAFGVRNHGCRQSQGIGHHNHLQGIWKYRSFSKAHGSLFTTHTSFQPIHSFFNFNKRTTPIDIVTHTLLHTVNSQYLSNILSWTHVLMVYIFESHLNFKFWGKFKFYMQQIRVTPSQYSKLNLYRKISLQNLMFLTFHTKNWNQPYIIFEIYF